MTPTQGSSPNSAAGPLAGVRILDLTTVVLGPYATQVLADLGADVIKVEPPGGDGMRAVGPMRHPEMGPLALHLNRNKRSVMLDLKQPEGRAACLRLAASCDALIYNIRPQAMARLGLDYAAVREANPGIVYIGAVGYGQDGRYAGRPAYDDLIQANAGIAALFVNQDDSEPRYVPLTLADRVAGLHAAIGLLAAVTHARHTGEGQSVEVPMFEALAQIVLGDHLGGASFEPPIGASGYQRLLSPHRRPYRTADGHLAILIYNDKQWRAFFDVIGRPELADSPVFRNHTARAAHIDEAYAFVAEVIARESTEHWFVTLSAADIPVARLNTVDGLLADPHLADVGFFPVMEHPSEGAIRTTAPVGSYSATPLSIRRPAPRVGEHSADVLREAGYDDEAISRLAALGVTRAEPG